MDLAAGHEMRAAEVVTGLATLATGQRPLLQGQTAMVVEAKESVD